MNQTLDELTDLMRVAANSRRETETVSLKAIIDLAQYALFVQFVLRQINDQVQ